eukprot:403358435
MQQLRIEHPYIYNSPWDVSTGHNEHLPAVSSFSKQNQIKGTNCEIQPMPKNKSITPIEVKNQFPQQLPILRKRGRKQSEKLPGHDDKTQNSSRHKIKQDYGWKTLLRGFRLCLRVQMKDSALFTGRHHWSDEKLFERTKEFMESTLGFKEPIVDKDVWIVVLLLNPAKGLNGETKTKLSGHPCWRLIEDLGEQGLRVYRDIFSNNNRKLVAEFFSDPIIRKLWEFVKKKLTYKMCFKKDAPNFNIILTYQQITKTLETTFKLEAPAWWKERFDYNEMSNYLENEQMPSAVRNQDLNTTQLLFQNHHQEALEQQIFQKSQYFNESLLEQLGRSDAKNLEILQSSQKFVQNQPEQIINEDAQIDKQF